MYTMDNYQGISMYIPIIITEATNYTLACLWFMIAADSAWVAIISIHEPWYNRTAWLQLRQVGCYTVANGLRKGLVISLFNYALLVCVN